MAEKKPETLFYDDVDFNNPEVLQRPPHRLRRCPVMVTLVDSQISVVDVQKMLEAGMNVAKFQLSSSTTGDKIRLLGKIDKAVKACCVKYGTTDWPVATCVELKTCIVKSGILDDDETYIPLRKKSEVILTSNILYYNKCNPKRIFIDNPYLATDAKPGDEISLAADEVILKCIGVVDDKSIKCIVVKGGKLTSLSRVCIRNMKHVRPLITKKDVEIIKFALEYQVDMIIINYIRHPNAITKIKQFTKLLNVKRPFILCGICTEEGLENIDDILKETDGLVLSREYLPYEIEKSKQYRISQIQKWVAAKCLQVGKPLYISGGVFEKALEDGFFIDSEISDVTNALLEGVSGFILKDCYDSAHTIEVLKGINELCYTIEPLAINKTLSKKLIEEIKMPVNAAEAAVISCVTMANQSNARVIIIPTVSGKTIRFLHWLRPSCLIITVSTDVRVTRYLRTYRSIIPLIYTGEQHTKWHKNISARIFLAVEFSVKKSWMMYGDTYITLQRGTESSSFCDTVRIWKVSISKKAFIECPDENEHIVSQMDLE